MSTPAKKPRQSKTPRQRAEEALGVVQRRVAKLERERNKVQAHLRDVEGDLAAATRRLDYLRSDPDLPKTSTPSTGGAQS